MAFLAGYTTRMRAIVGVALVLSLTGETTSASARQVRCDDPLLSSLRPPEAAPDTAPSLGPYHRLYVDQVTLGVGHLRPIGGAYQWEWYHRMILPLFATPDGAPAAWIVNGWLIDQRRDEVRPLGTAGMIETGYETPSFIVDERRDDGWLRMRYAPSGPDGGYAWTHQCLFGLGADALQVEAWEARMLDGDISPLFFYREIRHSLRSAPSVTASRVRWIPAQIGAYRIDPLEVRGDWMRVRVVIPSDYCASPDATGRETYDGWVKWRDDDGPWLWYHTRGC